MKNTDYGAIKSKLTKTYTKRIQELKAEVERLKGEVEKCRESRTKFIEAVGLATTIKGDMLIDVDQPLEMMMEVERYVNGLKVKAELWDMAKEMGKTFGVALPEWFLEQVEAALKAAGKE